MLFISFGTWHTKTQQHIERTTDCFKQRAFIFFGVHFTTKATNRPKCWLHILNSLLFTLERKTSKKKSNEIEAITTKNASFCTLYKTVAESTTLKQIQPTVDPHTHTYTFRIEFKLISKSELNISLETIFINILLKRIIIACSIYTISRYTTTDKLVFTFIVYFYFLPHAYVPIFRLFPCSDDRMVKLLNRRWQPNV